MEVVIKQWTEDDKKKMMKVVDRIHTAMTEELGKDFMMQAQVLELISEAVNDQVGFEKIMTLDKTGKLSTYNQEKRVRQIVEGMKQSHINLVLFRDEPEIWMQYYMGIFLQKPTVIIMERENAAEIGNLKTYDLVKHIELVDDFNEKNLKQAMTNIKKIIGGL